MALPLWSSDSNHVSPMAEENKCSARLQDPGEPWDPCKRAVQRFDFGWPARPFATGKILCFMIDPWNRHEIFWKSARRNQLELPCRWNSQSPRSKPSLMLSSKWQASHTPISLDRVTVAENPSGESRTYRGFLEASVHHQGRDKFPEPCWYVAIPPTNQHRSRCRRMAWKPWARAWSKAPNG